MSPRLLPSAFTAWVSALVALPLLALVARGLDGGPGAALAALSEPTARDALALSLGAAGVSAAVQALSGTAIAWALVRWDFPGRGALEWLVDLPFAIPTLVAGLLLVALYGPLSPVGAALDGAGFPVIYARAGVVLALLFVTLPFVVRAVQPVLRELDPAEEEAARMLGASPAQTARWVLLPPLVPAVLSGATQVFARSVAEFGSVAVVSGNLPRRTLTAPVYILGQVEAGDARGAAAVSLVLLAVALALQPLGRALARAAGARHA